MIKLERRYKQEKIRLRAPRCYRKKKGLTPKFKNDLKDQNIVVRTTALAVNTILMY
jgi:hypothetical protein